MKCRMPFTAWWSVLTTRAKSLRYMLPWGRGMDGWGRGPRVNEANWWLVNCGWDLRQGWSFGWASLGTVGEWGHDGELSVSVSVSVSSLSLSLSLPLFPFPSLSFSAGSGARARSRKS